MMAPLNPVAPTAFQAQEHDWVTPAQPARNLGRWRVLAPALSGLSVIAVVVGVTLAGGAAHPRTAAGSGAPPRFYVTLNGLPPKETAIVHDSRTGQTLASVHISEPSGGLASIAATSSDRVFYLAASGTRPKTGALATVILRLNLSADGRSARLTRLPIYLTDPTRPKALAPFVGGLAVSPDGRQLAAIVQVGDQAGVKVRPVSEIIVIPLPAGGRPAIWRASGDFAYGLDVTWVSNDSLAFLWQDQFKGTQADLTARTALRLLNVRSSNRNLLKSTVLIRGSRSIGIIEGAFAAPGGGPIIAVLARDIPPIGPRGTAVVRLVAASPATGEFTKVFASRVLRYRTEYARYLDDDYYEVLGLDASGKDALVEAPHFGMLRQGTFTALPPGAGLMHGVAW